MTTTDTFAGVPSPSTVSHRRRSIGIAAAGTALLVIAVSTMYWFFTPPRFEDATAGFHAAPARLPRASLHMAVLHSTDESDGLTATLLGADAHFSRNSADAHATFSVCRGSRQNPLGFGRGDLSRYCDDVVPLSEHPELSQAPDSRDMLVMTIRATAPGKARVDHVELEYSLGGLRFGQQVSQLIFVDVTVRATAPRRD